MNAFTKTALPALRVGYVLCNERTLPSLLQAKKLAIGYAFLDRAEMTTAIEILAEVLAKQL